MTPAPDHPPHRSTLHDEPTFATGLPVGVVDHPWLGRLCPLDDLLPPRPRTAPALDDDLDPSVRPGRRPVQERREPTWGGNGAGPGSAVPSSRPRPLLDRFFAAPITASRPVLAFWWGLDERSWCDDAQPQGVVDARTLGWMTQGIGGKDLPMLPTPAFTVDVNTQAWRTLYVPFAAGTEPTVWASRVGVWCCRDRDRLWWGLGAFRWCLDRQAKTLIKTGWTSGAGWTEAQLNQEEAEWFDLMGLAPFSSSHVDVHKGWANRGLRRAVDTLSLPNRDQWDDPVASPWAVCHVPDGGPKDRVSLIAKALPMHPANVTLERWQGDLLAHAQEWNMALPALQARLRRMARAARRVDPLIAQWARWIWSNPVSGDRLGDTLNEGWAYAQAWTQAQAEGGGAAEWIKQRSPFVRSNAVWRNGHVFSDASLGHPWFNESWRTPAGRRWARRQSAPSVRHWLRLQRRVCAGDESVSADVHEWGELLARWNVPRLPGWAVRAIAGNGLLRKSAALVLREELNDVAQPSWEQVLLRDTLALRRPHAPRPDGLRGLLHAWVKDVIARPWSARAAAADPMGMAVWTVAFQRAASPVPVGHERWSWSRWQHWVMQDDDWERWLTDYEVRPGGLGILHDGWRVTGLVPQASEEAAAQAWPVLPKVLDHPSDHPADDPRPASSGADDDGTEDDLGDHDRRESTLDEWMNEWTGDLCLEGWTVTHPDQGTRTVVMRRTRSGWRADLDRTPTQVHPIAQRWATARHALEDLGTQLGKPDAGHNPLPPGYPGLSPSRISAALGPVNAPDLPLALGRLDVDGWTLTPVASARDLNGLARLMSNCVGDGTYEPLLETGRCRLFVARGALVKTPALIDLRYAPGMQRWQVQQVEARDNTSAGLRLRHAANSLADLYTVLCPAGHASTVLGQTVPAPIVGGFDADTAMDLCDDVTGRNHPRAVSATLSPFTMGDPEALVTLLINLMPVAPEVDASSQAGPTDLVQRIVEEMYRQKSPEAPAAYQRGVAPEVDVVLDRLGLALEPTASWWAVSDVLFDHDQMDAARCAVQHAVKGSGPDDALEPDRPGPRRNGNGPPEDGA